MGCPVVHFEVTGKDGPALHSFYGRLFDWKINADNPWNYGMVEAGPEGGIGGGIGQSPHASYATFYVQEPDPQATLDQAVEMGGQVVMPVTEIPGAVTMALFSDPEGHIIGLVKG